MAGRIEGRRNGANYEIVAPDGIVTASYPVREALENSKLAASIARNGWPPILAVGEVL